MKVPWDTEKMRTALSISCYLAAVAAGIWLYVIGHLFATAPFLIGIQVTSALLMAWARITFGFRSFHAAANPTDGGLVTGGPYRYWCHPIYASLIYFVWAGQLEAPTVIALSLATIITLGLFARMLLEERFLVATYPEYSQYMRSAKRFVPFVL